MSGRMTLLATRMNRRQPARPGATHEPQQHGLGLIVARVSHGDDVGLPPLADTFEKCVARLARGLFQRAPAPGGDGGDVTEFDVETHAAVLRPGARRTRRRDRGGARSPWFRCARPAR